MPNEVNAALVIIGLVNGARLLKEQNYWGFAYFALGLLTGIVLGIFHVFGITLETGLLMGVGSSGAYRLTQSK